ncbi:MAG: DUF4376 domain-containing protein [Desulfuromonadaceae bacterium]|nr:DUF4376 domain-containing protein [Desulfuromonadaceae bacterium]
MTKLYYIAELNQIVDSDSLSAEYAAVELTEAEAETYTQPPPDGRVLGSDVEGRPVWVDTPHVSTNIHYSPEENCFIPAKWLVDGTYSAAQIEQMMPIEMTDTEVELYWCKEPPLGAELGSDENGRPTWIQVHEYTEADLLDMERVKAIATIKAKCTERLRDTVTVDGITWTGGEQSAAAINGAIELAQAAGEATVTLWDVNNINHLGLSLAQARQIAAQIALVYRGKMYQRNDKIAQVNAAQSAEDIASILAV